MDTLVPSPSKLKLRVQQVFISNLANKFIQWALALRSVNDNGDMGPVLITDSVIEPVDAALVTLAAPANTVVEVSPGVNVDISGLTGLKVQAWLQWHGEAICESRKDAVASLIAGV